MGYDASVFLIYGIKIKYDPKNLEEMYSVLQLIVPDLIEEYKDDVWSCFDSDPHINGYYCLNFDDNVNKESELFIACYFHEHVCARGADDCLEVILPSTEKMTEFDEWCVSNGFDQKPKLYTKLYESAWGVKHFSFLLSYGK